MGGRIGGMIISRENPYRSPQTEGRPTSWHFNFKLILYSAIVGVAVNLVAEIRLASLLGITTYVEFLQRDDIQKAWRVVIDFAYSAGTGAAIGALAALVLAQRTLTRSLES